jgi:hypothetical protein
MDYLQHPVGRAQGPVGLAQWLVALLVAEGIVQVAGSERVHRPTGPQRGQDMSASTKNVGSAPERI